MKLRVAVNVQITYYLSIFPRLSAAIIALTVNKILGYNALMLLAVDK